MTVYEMKKYIKNMSYDRALEKAMRYCSYQERCVQDLENRFKAWNVKKSDWDKLLDYLIKEDFLNEERYVEAYIRGKFLIKKWGRKKIQMGLNQKRLSDKIVLAAMEQEIEEEKYMQTINDLLAKKKAMLDEEDKLILRDKLYRFMLSRGFESELVVKALNLF